MTRGILIAVIALLLACIGVALLEDDRRISAEIAFGSALIGIGVGLAFVGGAEDEKERNARKRETAA